MFRKRTKKEEIQGRRNILMNELKPFKMIGVLEEPNLEWDDLDYLFEQDWELIAVSDEHYNPTRYFFKRRTL